MSQKGPIFILSVDGGGSRGVIPANILMHLQRDLNISLREQFDFFAGVSTGAMIAAYLVCDAGTVDDLANDSYSSENLSRIMDKTVWDRMLGRMQNQPKYDGVNKRAYVDEMLGSVCINDIVDKHLLIIAYDFISRDLVAFKNGRGSDASYNPTLAEICDASTAAPTLYPTVPTTSLTRRWLLDGALATNDPSVCALTESLAMGHTLDDIWMLSLGTGRPVPDLSQEDRDTIGKASRDWGVVGWLTNGLLDHMMSASSSVSAHQCRQLLGNRYLRVNSELPRKLMQLDNTSEGRVMDLQSYANQWYLEFREPILALIQAATEARASA
ncbi:patatin-like phospholipase family protein [Halioglobus pacificus]|uniref:Patatin n=1 Tax=Parahalioglobus pacificus TaxID=930806 RepID=A0A918XHB9_9GAMM|nr:patatin-like phospholipase family protein [Halioglobus pacificus]GHD30789.1 patatin [Halioglobus pacificus]